MATTKTLKTRMSKCVLTRHLMLQPTDAKEAATVVTKMLAEPGWTAESIVRQAIKRGWERKAPVRLVFTELERRGLKVKAVAKLARPLYG